MLAAAAGGGSNQKRVGDYNERLLLHCARRQPGAAAAELARHTGLSSQTVAGIARRLLAAGLLEKGRRRNNGAVGQPSVPLRLRADGVYSIGIKVGRTQSEIMLVDFNGEARRHDARAHRYPDSAVLLPWMRNRISAYIRALPPAGGGVAGVGVATFFGFGGWQDIFHMPQKVARQWEQTNFAAALATRRNLPVFLTNDATAACIAENELGDAKQSDNWLYIYLGDFIGGGVALNRQVFFGDNGNAGALASMPVGGRQLMSRASLYLLRRALARAGRALDDSDARALAVVRRWRQDAAGALAQAICAATATLDFNEAVIDGELPTEQTEALAAAISRALTPKRLQGLLRPRLRVGRRGKIACCLGAAWLPLYVKYSPTQAALLKQLPPVTVQ